MGINPTMCTQLEAWCEEHDAYREMVGDRPGERDVAWLSAMRPSAKLAVGICEDCVFKPDYDLPIKQHKIQSSALAEIIGHSPSKEIFGATRTAFFI